jgi:hypothetical protein
VLVDCKIQRFARTCNAQSGNCVKRLSPNDRCFTGGVFFVIGLIAALFGLAVLPRVSPRFSFFAALQRPLRWDRTDESDNGKEMCFILSATMDEISEPAATDSRFGRNGIAVPSA